MFENLSTKLKTLTQLTVLRIQFICTPDMISGLAENCPKLCELNLKGSERITDEECGEIAKCVSLQCLDITGTRITGKGCWKIIDNIKALSWLHHCAFNCNSDALLFESRAQLFDCIKEQVNRRNDEPLEIGRSSGFQNVFSLKNFWLFNPRTEDMYSTLLCPQLEFLRLDFIFQDIVEEPEVEVLTQIPKVQFSKKFQVFFFFFFLRCTTISAGKIPIKKRVFSVFNHLAVGSKLAVLRVGGEAIILVIGNKIC